jgi:nucleotide-binding universal stress UspA family protein
VYASIVTGTDGSPTAQQAVERAAQLAKSVGARLHVVTAYEPLRAPRVSTGRAVDPERSDWQLGRDAAADAILDEACSAARIVGIEAEPHARTGDPADVILTVAEEEQADLVVVGNRGMGGARRFLLGSVPDKVSHHAPCSVLILHTTD